MQVHMLVNMEETTVFFEAKNSSLVHHAGENTISVLVLEATPDI